MDGMTFKPIFSLRSRPVRRRTLLLAGALGWAAPPLVAAKPTSQPQAHTTALQFPDPLTLAYAVQANYRGLPLASDATLLWQRQANRYDVQWIMRVPLLGERTQRSIGRITADGLRPDEYVEQTNKRRSAVFDYVHDSVQFSGDIEDAPLSAGAQDRLTVSLQLGALLAAHPNRYAAGSIVILPVVGVRSAEVWRWDVQGTEDIVVAGRALAAVKLARQPRSDPDSQITLWLTPAVHHFPARLRVVQENGDVVDQQLSALPPGV